MSIKITTVDAVLDSVDGGDGCVAIALADLLDEHGAWDWDDGAEHDPSDRLAVVESSGAYWLVYRGSEPDEVRRFASNDAAEKALADHKHLIEHR